MYLRQQLFINTIKYLIVGLVVFLLVYFIPTNKVNVRDTAILTIIITLILAIFEHVTYLCTYVPSKEPFDSVDTPKEEVKTVEPIKVEPPKEEPKVEPPKVEPPKEEKKTEKEQVGCRSRDDVITNEMPYTDYNHLPLAEQNKGDFEYGYSFLPPEKWYPQPPVPPVCVAEKKCPVCPVFTTGTPVDVKEWNASRRIMPPDNINTDYIKEKLNSGR